jgi:hypothetical protein
MLAGLRNDAIVSHAYHIFVAQYRALGRLAEILNLLANH